MYPLLYLTWHSFKNRMLVRVQRLRQPRYAVGLVFGLSYFYFIFLRSSARGGRTPFSSVAGIQKMLGSVELIGALALIIVVALAWIPQGPDGPVLPFTRADVQFLFPAPFTRRQLIRYRILRSQFGSLVGSAFFTVVLRPGSAVRGWTFLLGLAVLMSIAKLHLMGIMLKRRSMREHGWLGLKRQWLVTALFAGAVVVLVLAVFRDWAKLSALESAGSVMAELRDLFSTGLPAVVLWPFRAVVRLPLASSPAAFFRALPWTLGILALNYVWVVRSDAAFEEASAEFADKMARRRKGIQPSVRSKKVSATPFTLAAEGRPETAILWKNLIMVGRYLSMKTLFILVPFVVFFGIPFARHGGGGMSKAIGAISIMLAFMVLFFGPLMARNDLRSDLGNLAMLKAWPLRGAAIVRGEVLAPALILTVLEWLLAIVVMIFTPPGAGRLSYPYVVAGVLLAPGVILTLLLMQNAMAVAFPSWIRIGQNQPRGIDVMGQRMMMAFGMIIALALALLPAAVLAGIAGFIGYTMTKTVPVIVPAAIASAVLLLESYLGSEAIGRLLERTDVSAIDASEQ